MPAPKGYSRTQIALHWVIALLIVGNLVFGEEIGTAYRSLRQTGVAEYDLMTIGHIGAGAMIFVFGLWRLVIRLRRGVPEASGLGSPLSDRAAMLVHWAFYALILFVPVTGALAWFGGFSQAGELHELAKPVFIVLIAVHVLGALWHQYRLKDGLIRRMMRAEV